MVRMDAHPVSHNLLNLRKCILNACVIDSRLTLESIPHATVVFSISNSW